MRRTLPVFALLVALPSPLPAREWKARGVKPFEADLVIVHRDKAILETPSGEIVVLLVDRLSQDDQSYLKSPPAGGATAPAKPVGPAPAPPATPAATLDLGGEPNKQVRRFDDMGWGVESLALSPRGLLAAGKMDRALYVFDLAAGTRVATEDKLEHLDKVSCVAFSPAGDVLLTGGYSGQIQVWGVGPAGTLKPLHKYLGHAKEIHAIAFSPDGTRVLSGGQDAGLHLWTAKDGRQVAAFDGFDHDMKACQWTADGRRAVATDGVTLFEFDLDKREQARKVSLTRSWSSGAAAFSPDGAAVVLGDTYDLRVFDTTSGKEVAKLADNESQRAAVFTPDGTRLLAGGRGKVNVWDIKARQKIASIDTAGKFSVDALAVSADGRYVAAVPSAAGQSVQVFRLPDPLK